MTSHTPEHQNTKNNNTSKHQNNLTRLTQKNTKIFAPSRSWKQINSKALGDKRKKSMVEGPGRRKEKKEL
ncbi:MAG: hypothetical protein IJI98_06070 [Methanosphaera sp.]|nr:hypothetical protein [Methanosphaera sp.]